MAVGAAALITRQDFLDYIELNSITPAQATLIDKTIDGVTKYVENYCGRKFKYKPASGLGSYNPDDTPYDSIYDGTGKTRIYLINYPVISVGTLQTTYVVEDGVKDVSTINSDDYRLYKEEGIIELVKSTDIWGKFIEAPQSVEVYYKAGYATIPEDLQLAAKELVAMRWRDRRRDSLLKSESVKNVTFTYDLSRVVPEWVKDILDSYKRLLF